MSYKKYIDQLNEQGITIIPDFLNNDEIGEIQNEIAKIIESLNYDAHRSIFIAGKNQICDQYFTDSVDKISFFFEKDAFNENGNLVVDKHESINKIGHCLHLKNEVFKKITFSDKVKNLIRELGYVKPCVPQSMYIFKNPKVGAPVVPHKDGSFLYTQPDLDLVGLWFPMVDVNLKNGCLSYCPKSHLVTKRRLFVRNVNDKDKPITFIDNDQEKVYPEEEFVPIEVPAGSCVLIHGLVVHQSKKNETDKARPVYTFHLLDTHQKEWDNRNWLQETKDYKFPLLYEN